MHLYEAAWISLYIAMKSDVPRPLMIRNAFGLSFLLPPIPFSFKSSNANIDE